MKTYIMSIPRAAKRRERTRPEFLKQGFPEDKLLHWSNEEEDLLNYEKVSDLMKKASEEFPHFQRWIDINHIHKNIRRDQQSEHHRAYMEHLQDMEACKRKQCVPLYIFS